MPEPQVVPLASTVAVSHDEGVVDRERLVDGARWAIVEYGAGAGRLEWCETPHIGYVVAGSIRYEFEDGKAELHISAGDAFTLPSSPRHRGRNTGATPARLFIVDGQIDKATPLP
jgi:mannose-6-phosphate isomerase-like protein (cupin superfamily)